MAAKVTIVELVRADGEKIALELSHAERLLALPNCQWCLPHDSKFELTEDGLKQRGDKKGDKGKA